MGPCVLRVDHGVTPLGRPSIRGACRLRLRRAHSRLTSPAEIASDLPEIASELLEIASDLLEIAQMVEQGRLEEATRRASKKEGMRLS